MSWSLRRAGLLGLGVVTGGLALAFLALALYAVAVASRAPATSPAASDGGVHMRGEWTIEVRNPDGTLVSRREFENDYTGRRLLPLLLAGDRTPGSWGVLLNGGAAAPLPTNCTFNVPAGGGPWMCVTQSTWHYNGPNFSKNLSVSVQPATGAVPVIDWNKLKLSGTAVAPQDMEIKQVFTLLLTCSDNVAPQDCDFLSLADADPDPATAFPLMVTSADLDPTVALTEGQQVSVIIRISFD